jgi:hypothetical protein
MLSPSAAAFNEPVDPVALHIPTYFKLIKNPMDLGTIKGKLKENEYATIHDFACDVRLVFKNSITFNPPVHHVYLSAVGLGEIFENSLLDLVTDIVGELANKENMDSYLMAYPLRTFDLPPACLPSARIGLEMTIESNINNMTSYNNNNNNYNNTMITSQSHNTMYTNDITNNAKDNENKLTEKNDDYLDSNDGNDSESMDINFNENEGRALCRVESLVSSLYPADMRERDNGDASDLRYSNFNYNNNNNNNNNTTPATTTTTTTTTTFNKPQLANRALVAP